MSNNIQTWLIIEVMIVLSVILVCIASIAYDRLIAKSDRLAAKIDHLDNDVKQVAKDVSELGKQIQSILTSFNNRR